MPFESSQSVQAKILVIEDEDVFRLTLVSYLRKQNYLVMDAKNGSEGLAAIMIFQPDVVISDLHMPGVNGHQVINYIHHRYPLLPVIVISAVTQYEELTQSLREGAADFLMKPITQWQMVHQAIQDQLNRERVAVTELMHHRDMLRWNHSIADHIISMSHQPSPISYNHWFVTHETTSANLYLNALQSNDQLIIVVIELFTELLDAAFVSAALKFLIQRPFCEEGNRCSPKDVLSSLNWHIHESGIMSTVNCAVMIFNEENEDILYANAGLNSPHWLREHGSLSLGVLKETDYHNYVKTITYPFQLTVLAENGTSLDIHIERR